MLTQAKLPATTRCLDWGDITTQRPTHILSVGKAALDLWHPFGLIQVGTHRGNVFTHHDTLGRHYLIMVIEHPGTLMQLSITGHQAKENMTRDLNAWSLILDGISPTNYKMKSCAGCVKSKRSPHPAGFWDPRLNNVGLCDDHWRRRARYRKKPAKKINPSKAEAQMAGQLEMMPGDGTRVRVPKG